MLPAYTDILVVGAGPAGLSCAISSVMNGCKDITIVDAQAAGANISRAIVVHAKTIEDLDTIGCMEELTSRGNHANYMTVRAKKRRLARGNFPSLTGKTRFPYALVISQSETERILLEKLESLGVQVQRPYRVVNMQELEDGIAVAFESGEIVKARYVVGADGVRSAVRTLAGIPFKDPITHKDPFAEQPLAGEKASKENKRVGKSLVIADVHLSGTIPPSILSDELSVFLGSLGFLLVVPLPPAHDDPNHRIIYRMSCPTEPGVKEVTKKRLQDVLIAALGLAPEQAPEVETVLWSSRFRVRHAVADTLYRSIGGGIVALAGDAAHVHSPAGGQGMNLGIRDAIALGKILGEVVRQETKEGSTSSERKEDVVHKLEAYSKKRRAMALEVIKMTRVMTWATGLEGKYARKLRNVVWWLMGRSTAVSNKLALRLSGLQLGK